LLAVEPPDWVVAVPDWLADPVRGWLLPVFIVMSAVFATLSVRGDYKGLQFLALLTMLIALEIDQSGLPLLWAGLMALAPALVALGWGVVHQIRNHEDNKYSYFYPWSVISEFIHISIGLYAFPVIAPFVLMLALVSSYRTEVASNVHEELTVIALRELDHQQRAGLEPDSLAKFSLLAAIIAAPPSSRSRIAGDFRFRLKRREEDRLHQQKAAQLHRGSFLG